MKVVRGKALQLIEELINTTDSITTCLDRVGVGRSTYYGSWLKDPVFLEKLQEERANFESSLRGTLVSKRRRIEAIERIFNSANGTYERLAAIKAIKEELEGLDVRLGEPGSADDLDLQSRRRKAAAELEAWEEDNPEDVE